MKCSACGEENSQNARFCSACGAKLTAAAPVEPVAPTEPETKPVEHPSFNTAQPFSDNPYQPRRMPTIYSSPTPHTSASPSSMPQPAEQPVKQAASDTPSPRPIVKPSKVFLFDDEKEEEERLAEEAKKREAEERQRQAEHQALLEKARRQAEDPFFGDDEDEDYDEDDDEDDDEDEGSGRTGKIFVVCISLITVLILVIGAYAFFFYTSLGSRLRAYYGFSATSEDYSNLAEWQLSQGNKVDAADSWYKAFLLNQNDYDFALQTAQNFERCSALSRAEQMYMYLITNYPTENDSYDYLMALLVREEKTAEYEALISYRAEHQPDYAKPNRLPPAAPTADPPAGQYKGSVRITLTAEEGASIYLTVDGSEPTTTSTLYTGPLSLYSQTYTLKAIAVIDGLVSPVFEATYVVS